MVLRRQKAFWWLMSDRERLSLAVLKSTQGASVQEAAD